MTSEFGGRLRHARANLGVSLRDAERATRISRQYLRALEREEFSDLPALTYARGIVRRYAEYLGLDPIELQTRFEEAHGQRSGGFRVVPAVKPLDVPSHWAPNFAIIAFMVVMSAVIFAWMYSAYFAPADPIATTVPSLEVAARPRETFAAGGGPVLPTPTPVPSVAPTAAPSAATPTPAPSVHQFTVTATHQVWIQVTVDGKTAVSTTFQAGESKSWSGKQMSVVSGDAATVRVTVDGTDTGPLGTTWNTQRTYPAAP